MTLSYLLNEIDMQRTHANLSSHIRLYVLDYYRARLSGAEATASGQMSARANSGLG
jgi:predicted DNA-binding ribbon-helix-helix protein